MPYITEFTLKFRELVILLCLPKLLAPEMSDMLAKL